MSSGLMRGSDATEGGKSRRHNGSERHEEENDEPVGEKPQAMGTKSESGLYAELLAGAGCKLICVVDS